MCLTAAITAILNSNYDFSLNTNLSSRLIDFQVLPIKKIYYFLNF